MLATTPVPARFRRLVGRVVGLGPPRGPGDDLIPPAADDARLRELREELGRELERVARREEEGDEAPAPARAT
jgi:hypothetical protein